MPLFQTIIVPLLSVIDMVLELYLWCVFAMVIISWLHAFNILNMSSRFMVAVSDFLRRITEPFLQPVRKFLPLIGGIDLSPLVLVFGIIFLRMVLRQIMVLA